MFYSAEIVNHNGEEINSSEIGVIEGFQLDAGWVFEVDHSNRPNDELVNEAVLAEGIEAL